ncbi:putative cyclin-dependent kinase F-2 [Acorus gramineus]|uniref:non-specific serine/threonine protein kinase n=1 Tax=Acorus gramineus TaxID=55184 RepID=A0AAV9ASK5_ACOGR|nr:putative cyclin-dependent kinase F-2 [Acorus gramineus]
MHWFKPFMGKESAALEGRTVDIGNLKIHIRNPIAEGGFSCVYLARDVMNPSKQYALKHIICNDGESLELVKKEISVMKSLKGHPNVVALLGNAVMDMGRTMEALLVMEFCEKSLVGVLENRGVGYFEEKQILLIFRDVCNAVFAMHCQSPPIAHRDLKAENVLLGPDGSWKLCDFGSSSTNHKRFDRPEEMGIEEDNIRKHTTPAYRAPEMWDLFRKEFISEKVDIWALGCLLYRICYFKSAFDGESKLQILNGNYRIPDLPKYSSSITDLIKDLLQSSPDARPDITQVWFRVNLQLPVELQKHTPDGPVSMTATDIQLPAVNAHEEGVSRRSPPMPRRAPPPPPSSREHAQNSSPSPHGTSKASANSGEPIGAFWSTQHAQDVHVGDERGPVFDEEPTRQSTSKHNQDISEKHHHPNRARPSYPLKTSPHGNSFRGPNNGPSEDFEIRFYSEDTDRGSEKTKASLITEKSKAVSQNEAFNAFVADFDTSKLSPASDSRSSGKEEVVAEVERLKEQLKQTNLEKAEITSKYEKLSAICRSQRQEIQELKNALASANPSINKDSVKSQGSPVPQREKIEGTVWELQQGMFTTNSASPTPEEPKTWQPFADDRKPQPPSRMNHPKSVRTITNGHQNKQSNTTASDTWGFGQDGFTAVPSGSQISRTSDRGSSSQRMAGDIPNKIEAGRTSQPAGWAGF